MQLLPVVIFIVLLSFIGIYINVYKSPNLTDPELLMLPKMFRTKLGEKEELDVSELSADELAARLVEEKEGKNHVYDSIGNLVGVKKDYVNDGMKGGIVPKDTDYQNLSSVGSKRPYAWHGASSQREWGGLGGLPYNVYHKYELDSLEGVKSSDKNKHVKMAGPVEYKSEGQQNVGFFLGKDKTYDELESNQSSKYINQAVAIIRNAAANEKKQLVTVDTVDRSKTGERYGKKNNNSISSYTNIKVKPNINTSLTDKDISNINDKDININTNDQLISQVREFVNN